MPEYPNLERSAERSAERFAIVNFLNWLSANGVFLAQWDGDWAAPIPVAGYEPLVCEYLGIDMGAVEAERRALIAEETKRHQEAHGDE